MFSNLGQAVFSAIPSHLHPLAQTALEHVGLWFAPPSTPHTLVSDMNFLSGQREEFPTSEEYEGIFKH